jgi:peroxiredoxin
MSKKQQNMTYFPLIIGGIGLIILSVVTYFMQANQNDLSNNLDLNILPPVEIDQPAPDLSLSDLNGNLVSLDDFRGDVILVNNWATWCPPCRQEMPEFQSYYEDHLDEGFRIVAVEAGQPAEEVQAFANELGLSFTILLDPENISLTTFQNSSLPNTWVIDRKGNLRLAWLGAINEDTLDEYVTPLLKE